MPAVTVKHENQKVEAHHNLNSAIRRATRQSAILHGPLENTANYCKNQNVIGSLNKTEEELLNSSFVPSSSPLKSQSETIPSERVVTVNAVEYSNTVTLKGHGQTGGVRATGSPVSRVLKETAGHNKVTVQSPSKNPQGKQKEIKTPSRSRSPGKSRKENNSPTTRRKQKIGQVI